MKNKLPQGYFARPAVLDDCELVVGMLNSWSKDFLGVEKFEAADMHAEWTMPKVNPETDMHLVFAPDGELVGYCEAWDMLEQHVRVSVWGRVHPQHKDLGIGSWLLEWAEGRASSAIALAPSDARVVVRSFVLSQDEAGAQLFIDSGYQLIRHSLRMVIDLYDNLPEPVWPEGIKVRPMTRGVDEKAIVQAVRDSFQDHWGYVDQPFEDEYAEWMHFIENDPDFDSTLWFLALDGEQIAGISLCRPKIFENPDMGWVSALGVRRAWRRNGLGLALLQYSFKEFYHRGKSQVGLGVDAQNLTGAKRLYTRAGMHSDPNYQHSLFEKELRPGFEYSRQNL
jgi:GNAT superfamily N-acetyltransferase